MWYQLYCNPAAQQMSKLDWKVDSGEISIGISFPKGQLYTLQVSWVQHVSAPTKKHVLGLSLVTKHKRTLNLTRRSCI